MSQIPSYPVPPGGYQQQPYPRPAESNGMAVAGFVLSLLGLVTCFVLSPIGLILSVVGMKKKEQQGLAVAGLVLGIIGTLVFVGFLVYFIIVMVFLGGVFFWTTTAFADAAERSQTNRIIQIAGTKIKSHAVRYRMLPSDVQGTDLLRSSRDPWGRSLKYERTGDSTYRITSSGPDKSFGTRDDITRNLSAPELRGLRWNGASIHRRPVRVAALSYAALPP